MALTYDYTNIAPPGVTADTVTGINDLGQIVGYFGLSPFVYSSGAYSVLGDISKLVATGDINNLGQFPYYILSGSQVHPDLAALAISTQVGGRTYILRAPAR